MPFADVKYEINETDSIFTLGSDVSAGGGDGSTEYIYGYITVPNGEKLIFLPMSIFCFYGYDNESTPAEFNDYTPVRIYQKDQADQGVFPRLKTRYVQCKFTADIDSQKKFDDKFAVEGNQILEIRTVPLSGSSIDVSACRFTMTCRRIAKQLVI